MRILKFLLFVTILSSTLYMKYSFAQVFTALFSAVILFGFVFFKSKIKFRYNLPILIIFYLFIFTSLLSSFINNDIELLLGSIYLLIIFLSLFIALPSLAGFKSNEFVYRAILYVHIPIIFIPLVKGIGIMPYKGIFNNSNSFGIACSTLFAVVISSLTSDIYKNIFKGEKIKKSNSLYYFVAIPSLLILTIYSGSRTSFITDVFILIVSFGLIAVNFFRLATKKQYRKALKLSFFTSLVAVIVFWIFPIKDKFEQIILYKFRLKSNDVLSLRGNIWETSLSDAKFFGNGRDYFNDLDVGAHNTFISLLGQYGWIPTFLFILIIIVLLILSLKYSFKAINDDYRHLPLMLLLTFLMLSIGEGMLFKAPMIGAFACVGSVTVLIRQNAVIGTNSVVLKDVPKNATVVGISAKII